MAFTNPYVLIGTATLIIEITVLFLLLLGYSFKRKFKYRSHGFTMTGAVILHLISILSIMIPSFVLAVVPDFIIPQPLLLVSLVGLIHGVAGLVAIALGLYLVVAWRFRVDVSGCFGRKKIMPIALSVWVLALILGIVLYAIFYGPMLFG